MEKNSSRPSVLVIIAALNEEKGISLSLAELRMVLPDPKYLVVDGNSADRTAKFAKELGAEILFQEGIGKGDAIAQAIKSVESDVNYVILTDADYTYPAKSVPEMIRILEENPNVGMVCGNRFTHSLTLSAMKSFFFVGNKVLALTQRLINGVHLNDPLTGLRVIRWPILKNWEPKSKGFDIEAEINHRVENEGYKIIEIPIQYRSRVGEKKLKLKDGLTIFKRIVTESLSYSS
ncbi:MAG: glycosyltransferase family 2 protein [Candidatus Bathyarchaeota archaeon]